MNRTAIACLLARSRWGLIVAAIFALLGSYVAPAQAAYYGDSYYRPYYGDRSYGCSYRYGCPGPRYYNYNGCSPCGCYRRCGYGRGAVYERRYIEREYVERRYGYGGGYRRYYGCSPYRTGGGCYGQSGYYGGYPPGYGYGGIGRRWPAPYIGGYAQSGYYEEPPRPPPAWDGDDY